MITGSKPRNIHLAAIWKKIRSSLTDLQSASFIHIKRENNKWANEQANLATRLPQGTKNVMRDSTFEKLMYHSLGQQTNPQNQAEINIPQQAADQMEIREESAALQTTSEREQAQLNKFSQQKFKKWKAHWQMSPPF
jgi:hypothetical protein